MVVAKQWKRARKEGPKRRVGFSTTGGLDFYLTQCKKWTAEIRGSTRSNGHKCNGPEKPLYSPPIKKRDKNKIKVFSCQKRAIYV